MKIVFSGPGLAATGALAVGALEGGKLTPSAVALDKKINGGLRRAIKAGAFTGKANQGLTLMVPSGTRLDRVVAFGLGKLGHLHHEPDDLQYAALGRLDVVMAPVDGGMTLALPVMIRAKALGGIGPAKNMLVSPGQTVWVPKVSDGYRATLAGELDGQPNIMRPRRPELTYYRFHCGSPEKVCVEGSWFCPAPSEA